jgi:hypothetical protein
LFIDGIPTEGMSFEILRGSFTVLQDASPCDFPRAYSKQGPPMAFTRKAISKSCLTNPP